MELPRKLTSDLKILQHQMKLQIQTHQMMRIKQVNDPNNCKLNEDLREIEKRISSLGEKQNRLTRWLRKLLTAVPSNNAIVTKSIASSLGININGTFQNSIIPSNSSSVKYTTGAKKNKTLSPVNDQIENNGLKSTPVYMKKSLEEESSEVMIIAECKEKICENEQETKLLVVKTVPDKCSPVKKSGKYQLAPITGEICKTQESENTPSLSEPLTAEKERFLSAVGLVTRDILKELQNKRVERKRRSTANHTQFVYGSNWDISSKKRKKNNYLTSSAKQLVTRQAAKMPNPRPETPTPSLKHPTVSIFKTPLPVSNHSQNEIPDINTPISVKSNIKKELALLSAVDGEIDRICPPDLTSAAYDCKKGEMCFVCQKQDLNMLKCSCSLHYHHSCAEVVENCVGCGEKLKCNIAGKRLKIFSIEHNQPRFEFSKMVIGQS